jgi:hypothetical protein
VDLWEFSVPLWRAAYERSLAAHRTMQALSEDERSRLLADDAHVARYACHDDLRLALTAASVDSSERCHGGPLNRQSAGRLDERRVP